MKGEQAKIYINAGISTDHECFNYDEALDKLKFGMKVIIREGSAAKNFETLIPLAEKYSDQMMFCSDDRHPNDLEKEHINDLVKRAVGKGLDVIKGFENGCFKPCQTLQSGCWPVAGKRSC